MAPERLATAAIIALLALGGCAKSQQPLPNKNTNWLDQCERDADCGDALECRCGLCTVICDDDATCELDGRSGVCWQEDSEELDGWCDEPLVARAICVPPALVTDGAPPTDEQEPTEAQCRAPGSCVTMIAEGLLFPTALVVEGERVYWLETLSGDEWVLYPEGREGALKSVLQDGSSLTIHAADLAPLDRLVIAGEHAYFTHSVRSRVLSRVPLTGGRIEHIYEVSGELIGLAVAGSTAYFSGVSGFLANWVSALCNLCRARRWLPVYESQHHPREGVHRSR